DLAALRVDCDPDAPLRLIAAGAGIALAGINKRLELRAVDVHAHDAHPFAVTPIELAALLLEMKLLGRKGGAARHDGLAILSVEIGAIDRTVIPIRNPHAGPVNVPGLHVHSDPIGK